MQKFFIFLFINLSINIGFSYSVFSNTKSNNEIIVTASRINLPSNLVGSSYAIISKDDIRKRKRPDLISLIREIPGVSINHQGGYGSPSEIRIRGNETNHTLFFIDGIEVNSADGTGYDLSHISAYDIERIEVIKGAQSALWGSDAIGGVINIITKKPKKPFEFKAGIEGGSHKSGKADLFIGSKNKHISGSVFISGTSTENTPALSSKRGGKEKDGYKNKSINTYLIIAPNEQFSLKNYFRHSRNSFDLDNFWSYSDSKDKIDRNYTHYGSDIYGYFFNKKLQLKLSASEAKEKQIFKAENSFQSKVDKNKKKFHIQSSYNFETPNLLSSSHKIIGAFEIEKDHFVMSQDKREIKNKAYIAEYIFEIGDNFQTSIALRHDNFDQFKDSTTFRNTYSYLIDTLDTKLHSSIGTGVKAPTMTELFGFNMPNYVGNKNLKPEKSISWDIGAETYFFDDKLKIDLTYFNNKVKNKIIGYANTALNLDTVFKSQGIELSTLLDIGHGLSIESGAQIMTFKSDDIVTLRLPKREFYTNIHYDFWDEQAHANLNISYISESTDISYLTNRAVDLPSQTQIDFALGYDLNENIELYGRLENILNEKNESKFGYETLGRSIFFGVRARF